MNDQRSGNAAMVAILPSTSAALPVPAGLDHIVVGMDLDRPSENALMRSIRLAAANRSALRIVHALEGRNRRRGHVDLRRRIDATARIAGEALAGAEIDISSSLSLLPRAQAIADRAESCRAELIVIGAHDAPTLGDMILGTTAMNLLRASARPLLVAQIDHARPYENALVAIEDISHGAMLIEAALLAGPAATLRIVHAVPHAGLDGAVVKRKADELTAIANRAMAAHGRSDAPGIVVCHGDPVHVLTEQWLEARPDLVALATHGRSGLPRLLHGSIADFMLRGCPSDLLITRLPKD
jgi:nucleotide-binding universal stress UspA family protein